MIQPRRSDAQAARAMGANEGNNSKKELLIMITKRRSFGDTRTMRVTFSLPATLWADTIELVGNFDRGTPTKTVLQRNEKGWSATLDLPTRHTYQYRFLIDGKRWMSDCHRDGFATDAHGRHVSVVTT
jgi:hypothetical protein